MGNTKYTKEQIRERIQQKKILFDGAFGTYYGGKYDTRQLPELANLEAPERVKEIHREYLEAGAQILRTNTFAANSFCMDIPREQIGEVKVPNARRTLRPGMYARTIFNMGQKEGVMVPDVAVQKQVGTAERFVYVIEGDSVARRRRVDVGRQVGDRVDILSGVGADEAVAVTALSKLYDGAKVEIKQE